MTPKCNQWQSRKLVVASGARIVTCCKNNFKQFCSLLNWIFEWRVFACHLISTQDCFLMIQQTPNTNKEWREIKEPLPAMALDRCTTLTPWSRRLWHGNLDINAFFTTSFLTSAVKRRGSHVPIIMSSCSCRQKQVPKCSEADERSRPQGEEREKWEQKQKAVSIPERHLSSKAKQRRQKGDSGGNGGCCRRPHS